MGRGKEKMNELTAVYFMWKRELIRFFRAKSRVVGSLGMPFFFLAVLGTSMGGVFPSGNGSYLDFIMPGVLAMVLLFGSVFSGIIVIMDRQFGFLKETLVAPVSRTSIVLGKALGGATTAVLQGLIMMGLAILLGANVDLTYFPLVLLLMAVISMSFVSLGIALGSVMEDMHGFQLIMNFLVMPMFFLSGAVFPLTSAPEIVRGISYFDPMTYAVDALRLLLTGSASMPLAWSAAVLAGFFALNLVLAAYLFGRIES
ncbi:MAG: ABC transporter permease [Candidatus Micrarchaeota archaeon]